MAQAGPETCDDASGVLCLVDADEHDPRTARYGPDDGWGVLDCPSGGQEMSGDLLEPFPKREMRLDRSEYSGSFTGSEESDMEHEDSGKDGTGKTTEEVLACAKVPLEEHAARMERKRQARVAAGKAEDDSAGEVDSEAERSEDESSWDESSEGESSEGEQADAARAAKKARA